MRLRSNTLAIGLIAAALPIAVATVLLLTPEASARSSLSGPTVSTYELQVVNNASSDIKNIYATSPSGSFLGDRLQGRIVARTSAVIDLGSAEDPCGIAKGAAAAYKLRAVLYDGSEASQTLDLCSTRTWTIEGGAELDD